MKKFVYEIEVEGSLAERIEREEDLFCAEEKEALADLISDTYGDSATSYPLSAYLVDVMTADGDSLGSISLSSIDIELPRQALKKAWRDAVERSKGCDRAYSVVTDGYKVWASYSGVCNFLICESTDYGVTEPEDVTNDLLDIMLADLCQHDYSDTCGPCVSVSAV